MILPEGLKIQYIVVCREILFGVNAVLRAKVYAKKIPEINK